MLAELDAIARLLPAALTLTIEISPGWVVVLALLWLICRPRA
jgi:hypothetical protein